MVFKEVWWSLGGVVVFKEVWWSLRRCGALVVRVVSASRSPVPGSNLSGGRSHCNTV